MWLLSCGKLASRVVEQVVDMDKQVLLFLKQVRERKLFSQAFALGSAGVG